MLLLQTLLITAGYGLFAAAAAVLLYDAFRWWTRYRAAEAGEPEAVPVHWRWAGKLAAAAWIPLLAGYSIVVIPSGMAGVRVSQIWGARPGALYPGVHCVAPLIDSVALYDTRDHLFTTDAKALKVQTKEGLEVGFAVAVRYHIDPRQLDYIHANLPQPLAEEIVSPVVASAFREIAPGYLVRDVFSNKRDEIRSRGSDAITRKLAADGIVVKQVMLRDLALPVEYARGLEGMLLKEQENERLSFDVEIKQKLVRTAELEAEAEKARQVKQAEGQAQVTVLRAKAESDAMQYTLPLKEKQIQTTRLEAEARKESTVKNAEAMAESKVIDSRAELERGKLMAESEANRIRVTSAADAERFRIEGAALKDSPLLIQKIIAERLSDKVQIMMVPADGKFFFANDVLKSAPITRAAIESGEVESKAGR
jgi:regulator of protease activity HflC (stomatin/prohibitin superfamily)